MSPNQFLQNVLKSDRIAFSIDDLSELPDVVKDPYLYPRLNRPNAIGILYFTEKTYRQKGSKDRLSEEEYLALPSNSRQQYVECHLIHLAKATWDHYKNNAPFLAQIVVDVYNQLAPDNAVNVESLWSDQAKANGVSDVDYFFVEHAERTKNSEYLLRVSKGISKDEDPHGNLAKAASEALRRLEK